MHLTLDNWQKIESAIDAVLEHYGVNHISQSADSQDAKLYSDTRFSLERYTQEGNDALGYAVVLAAPTDQRRIIVYMRSPGTLKPEVRRSGRWTSHLDQLASDAQMQEERNEHWALNPDNSSGEELDSAPIDDSAIFMRTGEELTYQEMAEIGALFTTMMREPERYRTDDQSYVHQDDKVRIDIAMTDSGEVDAYFVSVITPLEGRVIVYHLENGRMRPSVARRGKWIEYLKQLHEDLRTRYAREQAFSEANSVGGAFAPIDDSAIFD